MEGKEKIRQPLSDVFYTHSFCSNEAMFLFKCPLKKEQCHQAGGYMTTILFRVWTKLHRGTLVEMKSHQAWQNLSIPSAAQFFLAVAEWHPCCFCPGLVPMDESFGSRKNLPTSSAVAAAAELHHKKVEHSNIKCKHSHPASEALPNLILPQRRTDKKRF